MIIRKLFIILLIMYSFSNFASENYSFKDIITNMQTLSGSFKQYNVRNNKKIFESSGRVFINKPNKFRWDILNPNNQILLSDGEKFWNYDVDLEQISIKNLKSIKKEAPIYIIGGEYNSIIEKYNIKSENSNSKSKLSTFVLTPKLKNISENKKDSNISAVKLTFSGKILKEIELYSNNKLLTLINFNRVKLNKSIAQNKFKLKIPNDVEIIK